MRVGWVGLGMQGAPIARRIVDAGFDTTLYARRAAALEPFEGSGAAVAGTLREMGERSDLVGVCVVNDEQVEEVLTGPDGILAGMEPGGMVAIHSTIHPDTCARLAEVAGAGGVALVDAPVSGGPEAAAAGRLVVMVGGDPGDVERARPVFESFGDPVAHMGPLGSGQLTKLVNNFAFAANLALARDAAELGRQLGIDPAALAKVLSGGSGQSFALQTYARLTSFAQFSTAAPLLRKDVDLVLDVARAHGADPGALADMAERALTLIAEATKG